MHVLVLIIIIYMPVAVRKKGWMRRFKEKLRRLLLSSKGESLSPLVTHMLNGLTMAFTSSRTTYLSKMPNVFIIVLNKIFLGKKVNCLVYLFISFGSKYPECFDQLAEAQNPTVLSRSITMVSFLILLYIWSS